MRHKFSYPLGIEQKHRIHQFKQPDGTWSMAHDIFIKDESEFVMRGFHPNRVKAIQRQVAAIPLDGSTVLDDSQDSLTPGDSGSACQRPLGSRA